MTGSTAEETGADQASQPGVSRLVLKNQQQTELLGGKVGNELSSRGRSTDPIGTPDRSLLRQATFARNQPGRAVHDLRVGRGE
jgi:hypothetical protein